MQTFTLLKRDHITRAETESADIEHLKVCGYVIKGTAEASSAEEAVARFLETYKTEDDKPIRSKRLKTMLWLGSAIGIMWFSYLIFVLLPMAF